MIKPGDDMDPMNLNCPIIYEAVWKRKDLEPRQENGIFSRFRSRSPETSVFLGSIYLFKSLQTLAIRLARAMIVQMGGLPSDAGSRLASAT